MTAECLSADNPEHIQRAADLLSGGGLVGIPTETVYGLAARADNADAVARLYAAKGRPRFNPLIVHVSGLDMAQRLVELPPLAQHLSQAFWPGPLTLVLPKKPDAPVCDLANAGLDTLALRAPAHPATRALLERLDMPLVAPSANPSGAISPTTARHVLDGLGASIDLVLDGGACPVGVESTVVMIDDGRAILLRPGGLARTDIEAITGTLQSAPENSAPNSPGMLKSHYAPKAYVRLNALETGPGEVMLGFGAIAGHHNLSPDGDLAEAATSLFAALRKLDALGAKTIAVAPIPDEGLGEAINDRLQRASAPRT